MIGFRDIENYGLALNFSFRTRRCVLKVIAKWKGQEDLKLTDLTGNGFQGSFVPGNHHYVESLLC